MKMLQLNFYGDPNLGLFAKASDEFCVSGNFLSENISKRIENILEVKVLPATIAGTDLIGVFSAVNSNGIVLPKILNDREIDKFKGLKMDLDLNMVVLKSKFTAVGNLILCNNKGAVISKVFTKKDKKDIENCLGVETEYCSVAGMANVGSCGVATNRGCLLHREATEKEMEKIGEILKVEVDIGTANFGSPFVGSCVIANSNGMVVSENTTGPELARLTEALGFL
jgi:translation initiation factor 6